MASALIGYCPGVVLFRVPVAAPTRSSFRAPLLPAAGFRFARIGQAPSRVTDVFVPSEVERRTRSASQASTSAGRYLTSLPILMNWGPVPSRRRFSQVEAACPVRVASVGVSQRGSERCICCSEMANNSSELSKSFRETPATDGTNFVPQLAIRRVPRINSSISLRISRC